MFMRYTHYGVGHPVVMREMTRDCANIDLAHSPESEDDEGNEDQDIDIQPCEGSGDGAEHGGDDVEGGEGEEDSELEEDSDEQECDDSEESGADDSDDGEIEGEELDEEDDYHVSF
jgi:hypothetical protein